MQYRSSGAAALTFAVFLGWGTVTPASALHLPQPTIHPPKVTIRNPSPVGGTGANGQVYVLNPTAGQVLFGDGTHGRTLPTGNNNIVAGSGATGSSGLKGKHIGVGGRCRAC